jgi:hypothetical protein
MTVIIAKQELFALSTQPTARLFPGNVPSVARNMYLSTLGKIGLVQREILYNGSTESKKETIGTTPGLDAALIIRIENRPLLVAAGWGYLNQVKSQGV